MFPAWFALVAGGFLVLEARKQYQRFFKKGAASVCGVVSIVNELHDGSMHKGRLIPRTLDLPIYSVAAFNDKVNEDCGLVASGISVWRASRRGVCVSLNCLNRIKRGGIDNGFQALCTVFS